MLCATGNRYDARVMGHVLIVNDTVSFDFGTCLATWIAICRLALWVFLVWLVGPCSASVVTLERLLHVAPGWIH